MTTDIAKTDQTTRITDITAMAENAVVDADPVAFARSLATTAAGAVRNPIGLATAAGTVVRDSAAATVAAALVAAGQEPSTAPKALRADKRFRDEAFQKNPFYFLLAQEYLVLRDSIAKIVEDVPGDSTTKAKAKFASDFVLDACSPTNTFWGNPAAVRRAFDTAGGSVLSGLRNMTHDIRHNDGWPSQVDTEGFEVGKNMASTPGQVVYRSDLIELIQYTPQTEVTFETPLLFLPPWINKYYIMDLAPGKSLIEWAVQHGHTCFAVSYRNPDASMKDLGFRDYLFQGPVDAIRVVKEITGVDRVNTLSVCLGGTLTALTLAYQATIGDDSVNSATFINTHTDFTEPGVLGVFTDEATVAGLERDMAKKGFLDSAQMARTFSALRANDLVFSYVANNWLLGNKPPKFDLLVWNDDSTRMPARMHSEYLRSCYLENQFARGEFEIEGTKLDPGKVMADNYVVSAVDDHIVPWTSAYKTTQLLGGDSRFVLSTSGHIAGIVSPPGPKSKHWVNDNTDQDSAQWRAGSEVRDNSWWTDWTPWIEARGGAKVPAPTSAGSEDYPVLEPAPGSYVRG